MSGSTSIHQRMRVAVLFPAICLALAGCGQNSAPSASSVASTPPAATPGPTAAAIWPAPADPLGLAVEAGLTPETVEHLDFHVHAHLDVFIDGAPVLVPAGIGINIADPGVKRFDDPGGVGYGGIQGCATPCISPLHTHDGTGVIHTESATTKPNTLGQLFTEWDVELSATCVGEYCDKPILIHVDGVPYEGDPRAIELTDRKEIAIVIGTPPAVIPAVGDFSAA